MGRVAADGQPILIPRTVFGNHAHFLGDSGAGKTSLGFLPWIEQTIAFGDCSLICIDLKGDTWELLETMRVAADSLQQRRSVVMRFSAKTSCQALPEYRSLTFSMP